MWDLGNWQIQDLNYSFEEELKESRDDESFISQSHGLQSLLQYIQNHKLEFELKN
jgi:hypothetical protein